MMRLPAAIRTFARANLTRRANHWHTDIIAEIIRARAGYPAAGFFLLRSQSSKTLSNGQGRSAIQKSFDTSGKSLAY
jgi:hypothetical protein